LSCSAGVSEPDDERESASEIPSAAGGSSGSKTNHKGHPFDSPALAQGRLRTHEGAGGGGIRGWGDLGFGGHHL